VDDNVPSCLIVQQQAEFFKIAYEHKIDMGYLNAQGGTYINHLAAIRTALKDHMLSTLKTMRSFYIFINYWSHMIRGQEGCSLVFAFFLFFAYKNSVIIEW
jgi:hypothetical protein